MGSISHAERAPYARNLWIEALRIVAAFGIVWFHAGLPGRDIALAGLSVFLSLSTYLECRRDPTRPLEMGLLAQRLLLPWAIAFAGYAVVAVIRHKPLDRGSILADVLVGPSPHLWFLPYIFAVLVLIRSLRARSPRMAVTAAALLLIVLDTILTPVWTSILDGAVLPLPQYAVAAAPTLFGVALASAERRLPVRFAVALLLALMGLATRTEGGELWLPITLGCLALTVAAALGRIAFPLPAVGVVSSAMLGVYLLHPLFLSAVHALHMYGRITAVIAFAGSLAAMLLAQLVLRRLRPAGAVRSAGEEKTPRTWRPAA